MKKSKSRKVFEVFNIGLMLCLAIITLYPLLNQLALSLSSPSGILQSTVYLLPKDFTLATYKDIINQDVFWLNYRNTIMYTVLGTTISLFMTSTCAYALSKKQVIGGNVIMKLIVFSMFFNGGLIPTFVLIRQLNMIDTIWAIVLPGCIVPYNVLIMRTYFKGLPEALEDAASIDGLSQFGFFTRIALPLSKPIIATMTLFISVIYWNDWFSALIYLNDSKAYPVTLYLRNALMGAITASQDPTTMENALQSIPQSIQAASMILVITPIICVYPFVQKYFVKGVMIGSIKG